LAGGLEADILHAGVAEVVGEGGVAGGIGGEVALVTLPRPLRVTFAAAGEDMEVEGGAGDGRAGTGDEMSNDWVCKRGTGAPVWPLLPEMVSVGVRLRA